MKRGLLAPIFEPLGGCSENPGQCRQVRRVQLLFLSFRDKGQSQRGVQIPFSLSKTTQAETVLSDEEVGRNDSRVNWKGCPNAHSR